MKKSIVLGDCKKEDLEYISSFLDSSNYYIAAKCLDGFDLIHKCESLDPDVTITNMDLKLLSGVEAVKRLRNSGWNNAVIFIGAGGKKELDNALKASPQGYVTKPLIKEILISSIEVGYQNGLLMNKMVNKIDTYEKKLKDRKVIEQAKGLLMDSEKITESEAYNVLRQASMDMRVPMGVIAEAIVKDERA